MKTPSNSLAAFCAVWQLALFCGAAIGADCARVIAL